MFIIACVLAGLALLVVLALNVIYIAQLGDDR
jgi:hypothetical protein